uniref:protein unc-93 homolog A-like n=1 Tax=Styela clava TaxID=7725 RepID=UPI001939FF5E|nr:protein unc-93 homolog A-like [Styela clava]
MAEKVENRSRTVRKVWKCFFLYSFGVFLQYAAYGSLLNLQSSINIIDGLGTYCASIINITAVLFTLFCVPSLLRRFGAKKCFCWCECTYILYTVANMYPTYYTMVPASFLVGIGDSTLWSCMPLLNSYFATKYSAFSGNGQQSKNESRFSGYFYSIVLGAKIPGNIITYIVLYAFNTKSENPVTLYANNITFNVSNEDIISLNDFEHCGANDCQDAVIVRNTLEQYVPANRLSIYILMGILTMLCVMAVVIHFVFIPETGDYGVSRRTSKMHNSDGIDDQKFATEAIIVSDQSYVSFAFTTVKDIGRQVVDFKQILVTLIFIYHGMTYGYITSEITRSYTTCAFGVAMVPVHSVFYGIGGGVVCYLMGKLGKQISRDWFFVIATLTDMSIYIYGLLWSSATFSSHWCLVPMYFLFGGTQGIWMSNGHVVQVNYFRDRLDVACPVWNIYYMLGIAIQFAWSTRLCVRTKIFIQMGVLIMSMIGYVMAETLHRRQLRRNKESEVAVE